MREQWQKNTILFLTSQTISLFGSMLVQYAITWHITLKTQSGVMMTLSIICGFLPTFFLSPFAGVWADRYSRKRLIIMADTGIALSTLTLALLFMSGHDSIYLLLGAMSVRALGAAVQTPCVSAVLPQLVPEDKLMRVNAINSSIMSVTMLICPMLSGALLTFAPIETIFFIDVVTAAIAVFVMAAFLHIPLHAKAAEKQTMGYFEDMGQGWLYIWRHKFVMAFFVFCTIFFVLVAPAAFLTPIQVARSFGPEVWRLTAIEIAFSVGMMLGGIAIASWGGFKNRVHTMALSSFIIGIATFALGLVSVFWVYLIFMCVAGLSMPTFNTTSTVLLQEKVEEAYLGRVFGALGMLSSAVMPVAMIPYGILADRIKIEWILLVTGILLFAQGFMLLGTKTLVAAGKPADKY